MKEGGQLTSAVDLRMSPDGTWCVAVTLEGFSRREDARAVAENLARLLKGVALREQVAQTSRAAIERMIAGAKCSEEVRAEARLAVDALMATTQPDDMPVLQGIVAEMVRKLEAGESFEDWRR
jgi:hypothetical protein